ncbi:hypothetical protein DFP72DRAFT_1075043 [Ephemerocybe angulata]|uniref:Uncharacterized protein n=1 Tax=Ephemerocybe angulata TaxID=980116 RepID=A0A8H6LXL4_9AGAR|nr:hypothetical protein DFP72DRAFT_1075043 [Tulosesus angulatus]
MNSMDITTARGKRKIILSCILEVQRKPTSSDLVEIVMEWARTMWYTHSGQTFFLRDPTSRYPRTDIPPSSLSEVQDLVLVYLAKLVTRLPSFEKYLEPKFRAIVDCESSSIDTKLDQLLWLRHQSPAGYQSRAPAGMTQDGTVTFKWPWESKIKQRSDILITGLLSDILAVRVHVLMIPVLTSETSIAV